MTESRSSQLQAARRRQFVGREQECALVREALSADTLPFFVVYMFGPSGVGKTSLLGAFTAIAESAHACALYIDGRHIEPSPGSLLNALKSAILSLHGQGSPSGPKVRPEDFADGDVSAPESIWHALDAHQRRSVIMLDTYEALTPLDGWLRDDLLPTLPENVLLILSGAHAPAPAWRADPVWNTLIRPMPLRNLNRDESRAYLTGRNIPAPQQDSVLNFTHGHPLALSLVAETFAQRGNVVTSFSPEETPDVIKALLERFVQKVPSPAHRSALEACALVRALTEGLLGQMLKTADVHELFEWLRALSFIDSGRSGISPHDLAREAIAADVRWRNPDWYAELHKRARAYYNMRLSQVTGAEQQRVLFDFTFLHRDNAIVRQYVDWQESGTMRVEPARATDLEDILRLISIHEGEASAGYARHWFGKQPEGVFVLREANEITGWFNWVALEQASEADLQADPGAWQAWSMIRTRAPVRPGESAMLLRFWGARDTYQAVGPVQSLIFISAVQYYLTTPRLAYTLFVCADPDGWELLCAYADLERMETFEWDSGKRHFGFFGHDWRVTPQAQWLELMAERETALNPPLLSKPKSASQIIALSQPDFAEAIREALRLMSRSLTLRGNALLGSRLVLEALGAAAPENERVNKLRNVIIEAANALQATPRDMKLYRAFYHTFIKPAASQEQAAEVIDVPFSTYRRHLQTAIERVTDALWRRELGE